MFCAWQHNGSLFQTHKHTKMSSIITRPSKRTKLNNTPELPADVFSYILSYIIDAKALHKKKMRIIRFQIIVMNLYNPVKDFVYYDPVMKCSLYDSDEYAHNETPAVLQRAQGGENDGSWDMYQFDVRFQSTWETRWTIEWFRDGEQFYGKWGFYQRAKNMKL